MTSYSKLITVDYLFRGKEYKIICFIDHINVLKLEIEEINTHFEWTGSFSSDYIEELSKKTGNFKNFEVFVAMLQTVLKQNSESLSLDLMSFSDLEELRNLKLGSAGLSTNKSMLATTNNSSDINSRSNKRYLILTYTTDFDKVHYPLPMTFQGVPTISSLKEIISDLRRQIFSQSHSQQIGTDFEKYDISELNKRIGNLKHENEELAAKLHKCKASLQNVESNEELKSELKAVKSIVRTLEEELAEEKAKHQRISMRKNRENKTLLDEVSELKASKRNLNFRVHNLTNELAMYKRQRTRNGILSPRPPVCPSPKSSLDLLMPHSRRLVKTARETSPHMFSDPETTRITQGSRRTKLLHSSGDRNRMNSRRCLSADRYKPYSPNFSKFNPTEYVLQQKLKREEIENRKQRELRNRLNSNNFNDRSRDSSPASYRHSKIPINYRSSQLSSSNGSSLSNLDDRIGGVNGSNSKFKSTKGSKLESEDFTGKKRHPVSLNNAIDDDLSEIDNSYKYNYVDKNRKKTSLNFNSDDSSVNEQHCSNRKEARTLRRRLLDSDSEDINRLTQKTRKAEGFNKERISDQHLKTRKSRIHQSSAIKGHPNFISQSEDINDIDQRLNALQSFMRKYLPNDE